MTLTHLSTVATRGDTVTAAVIAVAASIAIRAATFFHLVFDKVPSVATELDMDVRALINSDSGKGTGGLARMPCRHHHQQSGSHSIHHADISEVTHNHNHFLPSILTIDSRSFRSSARICQSAYQMISDAVPAGICALIFLHNIVYHRFRIRHLRQTLRVLVYLHIVIFGRQISLPLNTVEPSWQACRLESAAAAAQGLR